MRKKFFHFLSGEVVQTASFNTHEVPNSGSDMASFVSSLPDKSIILMVVFYRAHVYYDNTAAASLIAVCPNAPLSLQEDNSNTLICLKGIGQPSWTTSMVSTYSVGPAVTERNVLLPKGKVSVIWESYVEPHNYLDAGRSKQKFGLGSELWTVNNTEHKYRVLLVGFTWRHGSHVCVLGQCNGGHVCG